MQTVYVDFDDVLCETARVLSEIIQREFGKGVPYEAIHSFDLTETFRLNEAESNRLFEIFHDPEVLGTMEPIADAGKALQQWRDAGVFIHIVTGRPPATADISRKWLASHNMPYDRMSFVDKYGRNHAYAEGADIISLDELRQMRFDLAVDDSPIAIDFLTRNTEIPVIIFDRPWNTELEENSQIIRCKSWQDVVACANSIFSGGEV